jgi:protein gp37
MAENTKIEWTTHTFNPWRGCTKVSDGCTNCYAETMSGRNPKTLGVWGKYGTRVVASESMWKQPLKWDKAAAEAGERHRVFCASLADVFEGNDTMPEASWDAVHSARNRLFNLIADTPNLDWLLLTKRPENVMDVLLGFGKGAAENLNRSHPNIWIGTSVEDQKTADERIPHLLQIPAKVRFLSMEPLLGPVNLPGFGSKESWCPRCQKIVLDLLSSPHESEVHQDLPASFDPGKCCASVYDLIHWVIVGGESGPKARPFDISWARSIVEQCKSASVPVFVKQLGSGKYENAVTRLQPVSEPGRQAGFVSYRDKKGGDWNEWPEYLRVREFPNAA